MQIIFFPRLKKGGEDHESSEQSVSLIHLKATIMTKTMFNIFHYINNSIYINI